jgi:hypothetical protein
MNMTVDEAWHEKSPLRIKLPTSSNWRTADRPDSVARDSDIVRPLKYGRTVEDSCVVNYEFARNYRRWIFIFGLLFCAESLRGLRRARGTANNAASAASNTLRLQGHKDELSYLLLFSSSRCQPTPPCSSNHSPHAGQRHHSAKAARQHRFFKADRYPILHNG